MLQPQASSALWQLHDSIKPMRRVAPRLRRLLAAGALAVPALACSCDLTVGLDGLQGGCPPTRGATQVKINAGSSSFCIDTTETTNAQYGDFVSSTFTLAADAIPDGCQTLTDPVPSMGWPPGPGYEGYPVTNVNWCQAYTYCQWAGKRLCGAISGGALAPPNDTNATQSQWFDACSNNGALAYPYGNMFASSLCGGMEDNSQLLIVGTQPGCVGGFPGIFDMSGNVWEWTDACDDTTPASDAFCDARGGAFDSTPTDLECAGERNWTRSAGIYNIGIRCCLDL